MRPPGESVRLISQRLIFLHVNACSLSKEKEKNVHIDIKCKKWFDENFVMILFFHSSLFQIYSQKFCSQLFQELLDLSDIFFVLCQAGTLILTTQTHPEVSLSSSAKVMCYSRISPRLPGKVLLTPRWKVLSCDRCQRMTVREMVFWIYWGVRRALGW